MPRGRPKKDAMVQTELEESSKMGENRKVIETVIQESGSRFSPLAVVEEQPIGMEACLRAL